MTPEEKQLLEKVDKKLDQIIAHFGIAGKRRMTPHERDAIVESVILRFEKRNNLKSLPKSG